MLRPHDAAHITSLPLEVPRPARCVCRDHRPCSLSPEHAEGRDGMRWSPNSHESIIFRVLSQCSYVLCAVACSQMRAGRTRAVRNTRRRMPLMPCRSRRQRKSSKRAETFGLCSAVPTWLEQTVPLQKASRLPSVAFVLLRSLSLQHRKRPGVAEQKHIVLASPTLATLIPPRSLSGARTIDLFVLGWCHILVSSQLVAHAHVFQRSFQSLSS